MSKKVLLIVNSKARSGDVDLHRGTELWRERGWSIRELHPERPDQINGMIRRYGRKVDSIILGGGDGTLNRAAEALVETGQPFGVIPLGTANDFARTMLIPTDPVEACLIIREGRLREIDLGWVNGKLFFNAAHIGLGEKVAQQLSDRVKKRWGVLAYLKSFVEVYRANRHFHLHLICNGREEDLSSIQVAVGNGRHYGGGMTISEDAQINDHMLKFYSLKPQSLFELTTLALAIYQGRVYNSDRATFRIGNEMKIRTSQPMGVDTDGELTSRTPAHFKIVRHALSVFVS